MPDALPGVELVITVAAPSFPRMVHSAMRAVFRVQRGPGGAGQDGGFQLGRPLQEGAS